MERGIKKKIHSICNRINNRWTKTLIRKNTTIGKRKCTIKDIVKRRTYEIDWVKYKINIWKTTAWGTTKNNKIKTRWIEGIIFSTTRKWKNKITKRNRKKEWINNTTI